MIFAHLNAAESFKNYIMSDIATIKALEIVNYEFAELQKTHSEECEHIISKTVKDSRTKLGLRVYCKECEEYFPQSAESHISGSGCIKCGWVRTALSKFSNTHAFVEKAKQIGHNNEMCDYSNTVYVSTREKVTIKCNKCNIEYPITPNNHLRGKGCPTCHHHTSRAAREWLTYIQVQNDIILQTFDSEEGEYIIHGTRWKADGYEPHTNTIYEFHGDYWHGNPNIYNENEIHPINKKTFGDLFSDTMKRESILRNEGFNIITIWESEYYKS
jgi:hypothetical protein